MDDLTRLARSAGRGDPEARRSLVLRAQPDVWRLCAALVGRANADDVAQDSFVRILRSLPSFRGDSSARTWMLSITRYACADWVRGQQQRRRLSDRLAGLGAPSEPSEAGRVDLDHLVSQLPADRRDAFVLTQVLGLSYAEAAEVCGCKVGTIRSRVSRAREQLVAAMREERLDESG